VGNWGYSSGKVAVDLFRPETILDEDSLEKNRKRLITVLGK